MKHCLIHKLALSALLAAAFTMTAGDAFARQPGEKPIGWFRTRSANSVSKPIYASELGQEADKAKVQTDRMAEELQQVKVNPEADNAEKAWQGSISLEQHRAEIAALRDKFSVCTAALEQTIREKEESGKSTDEERKQLTACLDHCKSILETMDKMHYNSSVLYTSTRKEYFIDGLEKHKKLMAQLQQQMSECPMMVKQSVACCMGSAQGQPGTATHDEPSTSSKAQKS